MIMYQKTYTRFVFLFFVPLVFVGAFFLLNLTLAVINSSFNENNKKLKAKLQKLEEVESDGALDDVLDSMQAKIRQLKRSRAKGKQKTVPRSERIDEGE